MSENLVGRSHVSAASLASVLVICLAACGAEQRAWETATEDGSIEAYEKFLTAHGSGVFADSATARLASLSWSALQEGGSREDFVVFAERFPGSPQAAEAQARSRWFLVERVDTGSIELPGDEQVTRSGPSVAIRPQWDSTVIRLDRATLFAVGTNGDTVFLRYLVPIDLASHKATIEPVAPPAEGEYVSRETWIPRVNTFTRRYNAFGTDDGALSFEITFSRSDTVPVRLGLVFERDLSELKVVHVLESRVIASVNNEN